MDNTLQRLLSTSATVGYALSLVWHALARTGYAPGMPWYAVLLFLGVFLVWFPTVFWLRRFTEFEPSWFAVFKGAPNWLVGLAALSFVYAFVNFILFMETAETQGDVTFGIGASGHAMAFYSAAWAINYAAVRRQAHAAKKPEQ